MPPATLAVLNLQYQNFGLRCASTRMKIVAVRDNDHPNNITSHVAHYTPGSQCGTLQARISEVYIPPSRLPLIVTAPPRTEKLPSI